MAREIINTGSSANSGDGEALRSCFTKINNMTLELYNDDAGDVGSFTNANGTYVSAATVNTAATGAVTTGAIDLSAVDGTDTSGRFLSKDNKWAEISSGVTSFTNANGTYISAGTVNTTGTGAVTVGALDLSAVNGSSNDGLFLSKDNTWATPYNFVTSRTKDARNITNATTNSLTLSTAPSPNNLNYVDLYIDGVYQNIAGFSISNTTLALLGGAYFPNGATVEIVITH
tara:strand:- start:352 stop:1041 length:690 start_codon:yes stop_codon:yes gene_type:complete